MKRQAPNPLDLLFFAGDRAFRMVGQPGAHILLILELDGHVNADRLRTDLVELARFCPALNGRLATTPFMRHACWRLDARPEELAEAVVERESDCSGELTHAWLETLLMTPMDLVHAPPVQFRITRRPTGDLLVMQWPHALMDGRGMLLMIDALGNNRGKRFAGDEQRTDYADVLRSARPNAGSAAPPRAVGATRSLARTPPPAGPPRLKAALNHLDERQTQSVADNARRLTGAWPSGRYIRACAIQAVHEHAPDHGADPHYRVHALVDCRPEPDAAVCWNLSVPLLLSVPASIAHDRRQISDALYRQMKLHSAAGSAARLLRQLKGFALLPTGLAAQLLRPTVSTKPLMGGKSMIPTTTLAADLLPPLDPPLTRFQGLNVVNYYHIPTIPPRPGLAVFVTYTGRRLNTTCVCCEPSVPVERARGVLARFVALLGEPVP